MKICKPLDLEYIRKNLRDGNMTLRQMGELICLYSPTCPYTSIQESRVQDWEFGRRSVPEYVYRAYALVVVDDWASDRHAAREEDIPDIDYHYGKMLNSGFGDLLRLDHQLKRSAEPVLQSITQVLAAQITSWRQHFSSLFGGVDMEQVWVERLEDLFPPE